MELYFSSSNFEIVTLINFKWIFNLYWFAHLSWGTHIYTDCEISYYCTSMTFSQMYKNVPHRNYLKLKFESINSKALKRIIKTKFLIDFCTMLSYWIQKCRKMSDLWNFVFFSYFIFKYMKPTWWTLANSFEIL